MTTTKTLYSFDRHTGAFTGVLKLTDADMQPQDTGAWRAPDNTLEQEPPMNLGERQYAAARNGAWVVFDLPPLPEDEPAAPPPPVVPKRKIT